MLGAEFTQGRLLNSRHYVLERNGVAVKTSSLLNSHSFHVPFENIPPRPQEITTSPRKWLMAAILFTLISVIALPVLLREGATGVSGLSGFWLWGVVAVFCWIGFFMKRESLLIYAQGQNALILYGDRPSPEEVKAFVRKMFEVRNKFLREKYGRFGPAEPLSERLSRLDFLRDQEVLSEEEYQFMRRTETSDQPRSPGPLGFAGR
jgi:hypothetical protein